MSGSQGFLCPRRAVRGGGCNAASACHPSAGRASQRGPQPPSASRLRKLPRSTPCSWQGTPADRLKVRLPPEWHPCRQGEVLRPEPVDEGIHTVRLTSRKTSSMDLPVHRPLTLHLKSKKYGFTCKPQQQDCEQDIRDRLSAVATSAKSTTSTRIMLLKIAHIL